MSGVGSIYQDRFDQVLCPMAEALQRHIAQFFVSENRIDRISVRAKSVSSFAQKAMATTKSGPRYTDPLGQIQDQLGARVITFYLSDVDRVSAVVEKYFRTVESKLLVPESESEFGYVGKHYVLVTPDDVMLPEFDREMVPDFFELQIKTLFQHAWSEANHDLGYKPDSTIDRDSKRRLAFAAAQAWGADQIFEQLFDAGSE